LADEIAYGVEWSPGRLPPTLMQAGKSGMPNRRGASDEPDQTVRFEASEGNARDTNARSGLSRSLMFSPFGSKRLRERLMAMMPL